MAAWIGQSSLISTVRRLDSGSQMGRRPSRILTRRASEGSAAITQLMAHEPSLARRVSMTDHLEFGGDQRELSWIAEQLIYPRFHKVNHIRCLVRKNIHVL